MNYNMVFLVVDDMEGMRRILTNSLNQIGVKSVLTAVNGAEAWRIIQAQTVDVVISDWNMPVIPGWICSRIFARARNTPTFRSS